MRVIGVSGRTKRLAPVNRRRRRLLAFVCVAALAGVVAALLFASRNSGRDLLAEQARVDGVSAYERGDYETAVEALMRWYRHQPPESQGDVGTLMMLAYARSQTPVENAAHLREAITLYNEALRYDPGHVPALQAVAVLYEQTRRRIEWMEAARRLLAIDPAHVEARRLKALGHSLDSRFDAAATHTAAMMGLEPHELRWRELHLNVSRDGGAEIDELLAMCDVWIEEQSEVEECDGRFRMLKARLLLSAGQREEARDETLLAARLGANTPRVLHTLTAMLDLLQLHEEAESLLDATVERHPDESWPHTVAVHRLWQHGRVDEALQRLALVEESSGDLAPDLLRWKSLLLILRHEHEGARAALAAFEAAARGAAPQRRLSNADRAWGEACRARVQQHAMNWRESIAAYRRAVTLSPRDAVLHFLLAEAYSEIGDIESAAASLEHAIHADPYWTSAQLMYSDALLRLERYEEAALLAADLVRRSPHPPFSAYLVLAHAWTATDLTAAQLGLAGDALAAEAGLIAFLEALLTESPESDEAAALLVAATMRDGHSALALDLIERMIGGGNAAEADHAEPWPEEIAGDAPITASPAAPALSEAAYVGLAALSEAYLLGLEQRIVDRAVSELGMSVPLAAVQARILHREGKTADAIQLFDQPIGSAHERAHSRAQFLAWAGHPDAVAALHRTLESDGSIAGPAGASLSAALAVLEQPVTWTDSALALRAIEALAAAAGDSPRITLARARYLATFEGDDPAAVAHAMMLLSDVLNRSPNSAAAHRLMAELYMLGSNPNAAAAARHLRRAVDGAPGWQSAVPSSRSADLYPALIELLQHQGDFDTARTYLERMGQLTLRRLDLRHKELRFLEAQGDYEAIVHRLGERIDPLTACEQEMLMLASSLQRTGRHRQAERLLNELVEPTDERDQPSLAALAMAARLHANQGRFDTGLHLLMAAAERDEATHAEAALLLGTYHDEYGSVDDAERWLRIAAQGMKSRNRWATEAWSRLAAHYLYRMNYAEARAASTRGLALDPAHLGLGVLFFVSSVNLGPEEHRTAMRWLDDAFGAQIADSPALGIGEALTAQRREGLRATLRLYAQLASRPAGAAPSERELAESRQLVQNHPWLLRAWRVAIAAHVEAGRVKDAAQLARAAAARFPNQHEPAEVAARLLVEVGELEEALHAATMWRERSLHQSMAADAAMAAILLDLDRGRSAARQLQPHEARIVAERNRSPDGEQRFRLLLQTRAATGDHGRALGMLELLAEEHASWFETALESSRLAPPATAARLLAWIETRCGEDAGDQLALASRWLALAVRSENPAHSRRAAALAEKALEKDDAHAVSALLITAAADEQSGDFSRAADRYRRVLEVDDRNWVAMNNLALVLLRSGADADEAVQLAARALNLVPEHPDVLNTHAQAQSSLTDAGHTD
jgi:tetratricopeptide (TPR) repeat protein